MRGLRSTLALTVVLAGLGAYIYFVTSKQDDTGATKQEKVFAGLEADKIEELKIRSESGDVTTVKKGADGWLLVSPVAGKASQTEVLGVTSALEQVNIERVLEEAPADLKEYGLDAPRIEIEFKSAGGTPSGHLLIGAKTATGGNLYAKRSDEKRVVLVPAFQETSFNKSTFDLRDKTLMTFKRDSVDGIDVSIGSKSHELRKSGEGWRIAKPLAVRADSSAVEGLVGLLETAQMKSIVTNEASAADLKKYGLDKPSTSVTLNLGSARATLAVGAETADGSVYVRDTAKPLVATVEKSLADDLKKDVEDYRLKEIFEFRAFNATRVEFTRDGKSVVFERVKATDPSAADTWKRVSPTAADAEKEKIELLLTGLADIRAQSFTESRANTGLDRPALTVYVKFEEGKKEERVTFGKSGKDVYAGTVDPGAAKIPPERFDEAIKTLDELSK
jgi:hypothetical protein